MDIRTLTGRITEERPEMTLRIAILGAGRIGKTHARAIAATPGVSLVAISDPVAAAAEAVSVGTRAPRRFRLALSTAKACSAFSSPGIAEGVISG